MPAYFIVQSTIQDEAQFQKYRQAVVPFITGFGGKLVARGAKVEVFEGEHDTRPVVMFEFPSMDAIRAFWNSPDYGTGRRHSTREPLLAVLTRIAPSQSSAPCRVFPSSAARN
jgi:uncharacterized protein (DUF1330 family)